MPTNFYMFFLTALIPLVVGAMYYHPKTFGTAWMNSNGFTEEDLQGGNMAKIFGLSYFYGILLSMALSGIVIHQSGVFQMMMPAAAEAGSEAQAQLKDLMDQYGTAHRSFGHGALHGGFIVVFLVLPIIAINALFERRGWKYICIHTGYWFITALVIGGILCSTLEYAPL